MKYYEDAADAKLANDFFEDFRRHVTLAAEHPERVHLRAGRFKRVNLRRSPCNFLFPSARSGMAFGCWWSGITPGIRRWARREIRSPVRIPLVMAPGQDNDTSLSTLAVVMLLVGTATGNAFAMMAAFRRRQLGSGPVLVALVAAVAGVLIAGYLALGRQ